MDKQRTTQKTKRYELRITADQLAELREQAEHAGMSLAEYFRRRALGRPVVSRTDRVLLNELRRLGGLLKYLHEESAGRESSAFAETYKELKAAIVRVGRSD